MSVVQTYFKKPREQLSEREKRAERELCHSRARWICQRCKIRRSVHAHHVLLRKQGGSDLAANLKALCEPCHLEVHAAPEDAYREGWLQRQFPREGDFHYVPAGRLLTLGETG